MAAVSSIIAQSVRRDLLEDGAQCFDVSQWLNSDPESKVLEEMCKRAGITSKSSLVWIECPHLKEAACRLIRHLTVSFPQGESSLVETAIDEAVHLYASESSRVNSVSAEVRFLSRLGRCADHVLSMQVIAIEEATGRVSVWDMWRQALPEWLRDGGFHELFLRQREQVTDVEKVGARTALTAKLVSHRELGMLEMHKRWRASSMMEMGDML